MSAKVAVTDTLGTSEVSARIGIDEKMLIKMIKNGEIVAIECGSTNVPTFYEIPEPEVDKIASMIKEKAEKDALMAEERLATSDGRKIIRLSIPTLDLPVVISYVDALASCPLKEIVRAACNHHSMDYDEIIAFKCNHSLSTLARKLNFVRLSADDGIVYFIAFVDFEMVDQVKKEDLVVENVSLVDLKVESTTRNDLSSRYHELEMKIRNLEIMMEVFNSDFVEFEDIASEIDDLKRASDEILSIKNPPEKQ